MWSFFQPRCPLTTYEKAWTEARMAWLAQKLGIDRLRRVEVVVPEAKYFAEGYFGRDEDVHRLFDLLRGWMEIPPDRVRLVLSREEEMPVPALGLYEREQDAGAATIRVNRKQLADPESLVATLAHELGHEILLGGKLLDTSVEDHEDVTDLVTVFLGLGLFRANATLRESQYSDAGYWSWSLAKSGYLPARMLGYAMALFAFAREERAPAWGKYLRRDAHAALTGGLKYLQKGGETLFGPDLESSETPSTETQLREALQRGNPSERLWAMWLVIESAPPSPAVLQGVAGNLTHRDPDVAAQAADTLGRCGPAAAAHFEEVWRAVTAAAPRVRTSACHALGDWRTTDPRAIEELSVALSDSVAKVRSAAAWALAECGVPVDAVAARQLAVLLATAIVNRDEPGSDLFAAALARTVPADHSAVEAYLAGRAPELRRDVLAAINQHRRPAPASRRAQRRKPT